MSKQVHWSFEWGYAKDNGLPNNVRRRVIENGGIGATKPNSLPPKPRSR